METPKKIINRTLNVSLKGQNYNKNVSLIFTLLAKYTSSQTHHRGTTLRSWQSRQGPTSRASSVVSTDVGARKLGSDSQLGGAT